MSQGAAAQPIILADATGYPRSLTDQLQASINTALTAGSVRVSVGYGLANTLIQNTQ